ncbi:hypothetical protein ARMSODRAFT_204261 [Armillaria solidipes]|uniref:Uncharacterized protein n=1 Tax=Armillaria solidipes TaxID=1076256 RepID=A0A2H3BNE0_9AGAR|nr:hypothetical protein ARMSODRAFT_204261 [Armillaria solidipes]
MTTVKIFREKWCRSGRHRMKQGRNQVHHRGRVWSLENRYAVPIRNTGVLCRHKTCGRREAQEGRGKMSNMSTWRRPVRRLVPSLFDPSWHVLIPAAKCGDRVLFQRLSCSYFGSLPSCFLGQLVRIPKPRLSFLAVSARETLTLSQPPKNLTK